MESFQDFVQGQGYHDRLARCARLMAERNINPVDAVQLVFEQNPELLTEAVGDWFKNMWGRLKDWGAEKVGYRDPEAMPGKYKAGVDADFERAYGFLNDIVNQLRHGTQKQQGAWIGKDRATPEELQRNPVVKKFLDGLDAAIKQLGGIKGQNDYIDRVQRRWADPGSFPQATPAGPQRRPGPGPQPPPGGPKPPPGSQPPPGPQPPPGTEAPPGGPQPPPGTEPPPGPQPPPGSDQGQQKPAGGHAHAERVRDIFGFGEVTNFDTFLRLREVATRLAHTKDPQGFLEDFFEERYPDLYGRLLVENIFQWAGRGISDWWKKKTNYTPPVQDRLKDSFGLLQKVQKSVQPLQGKKVKGVDEWLGALNKALQMLQPLQQQAGNVERLYQGYMKYGADAMGHEDAKDQPNQQQPPGSKPPGSKPPGPDDEDIPWAQPVDEPDQKTPPGPQGGLPGPGGKPPEGDQPPGPQGPDQPGPKGLAGPPGEQPQPPGPPKGLTGPPGVQPPGPTPGEPPAGGPEGPAQEPQPPGAPKGLGFTPPEQGGEAGPTTGGMPDQGGGEQPQKSAALHPGPEGEPDEDQEHPDLQNIRSQVDITDAASVRNFTDKIDQQAEAEGAPPISPEEKEKIISDRAYYLSQHRTQNQLQGDQNSDWYRAIKDYALWRRSKKKHGPQGKWRDYERGQWKVEWQDFLQHQQLMKEMDRISEYYRLTGKIL